MEISAIILCSIFVLFVSYFLFKEVAGTMALRKLNMLSYLFYVPLVLMSFIGSIFIVLQLDDHYLVNKLNFERTRYLGWLAIMYTMIMLPLGMLLAKKVFKIESVNDQLNHYSLQPIANILKNKELVLKSMLIGLSVLGLAVIAYTFIQIGSIPLLALIKGIVVNCPE